MLCSAYEVETREGGTLLVEVAGEGLLADLELLKQVRQEVLQHIVTKAVLYDIARLEGLLHNLLPVLIDRLEALRLLRHLLCNVARVEDRLEVHPHRLDLDPLLQDLGDKEELLRP